MNQQFDSVEEQIKQALIRLQQRAGIIGNTSAAWTRAVKNAVGRVGANLGYEVYASSCHFAKYGEWLFDLTWADYDEDEYLRSIPLVLECEWIPKEVCDDFCKLMVSRADHRVIVFWTRDMASMKKMVKELIEEVKNSQLTKKGDRYLFACLIENSSELFFQLYVAS